jgi:CHAT domain-containing protein
VGPGLTPGPPAGDPADEHSDHRQKTAGGTRGVVRRVRLPRPADLTAPSRSGLCLYDGTLPVADISRLRLDHAELAYLSACSTAHRGIQAVDESLHLASAFQLAGFRYVIASLWPLNDRLAATVFYQHLPAAPAADHASSPLHQVTRELRGDHPDRPDLWAALIHSGA